MTAFRAADPLFDPALNREGLRPIIYVLAFDSSIEFWRDAYSQRFRYNSGD